MKAEEFDLDFIFSAIWSFLSVGSEISKSDFHLAALCTLSNKKPRVRTVVLRRVIKEDCKLIIHTDRRSAKFEEIKLNPTVSLLFYSKENKVQIRLEGIASLHTEDILAKEQWENSKLQSRKCYLSELPPGTEVKESHSGASELYENRTPSEEESTRGQKNFCAISIKIKKIDWLYLRSKGHLRCMFIIDEDNIEKRWLVP